MALKDPFDLATDESSGSIPKAAASAGPGRQCAHGRTAPRDGLGPRLGPTDPTRQTAPLEAAQRALAGSTESALRSARQPSQRQPVNLKSIGTLG